MKITASPNSSFNEVNGKDLRARLTKDYKIIIGGVEIDTYIAQNGVQLDVGGPHSVNELVVRFLVGDVEIDDEIVADINVRRLRTA